MGFRELVRDTQGLARVVDTLAKEHAQTRGVVNHIMQFLGRGFGGRLKWLIFGK